MKRIPVMMGFSLLCFSLGIVSCGGEPQAPEVPASPTCVNDDSCSPGQACLIEDDGQKRCKKP